MRYNFKNIIFFLVFFFMARLGFLITYFANMEETTFRELVNIFLTGLRFDFSTTMILLALPLSIIWVYPKNERYYTVTERTIQFIFAVVFVISIFDIVYYNFSQKRLGFEIFIFLREPFDTLSFIFKDFWFLCIIAFGFLAVFLKIRSYFFGGYKGEEHVPASLQKRLLALFISIIVSIIGIRGGLQSKPLKPLMAFQSNNLFSGQMALNGLYTVFYSIYKSDDYPIRADWRQEIKKFRALIAKQDEIFPLEEYPFYRKNKAPKIYPKLKKNLVLIVMESWGMGDIGYSQKAIKDTPTPFFDNIARRGLFFTQHYSAGQRSIAMPSAILSSIPPIFGNIFANSSHQHNRHKGLTSILKDIGYQTIFIHAAKEDSMGFSSYATASGFQKVITKDSFDLSKVETDGVWGVFDEYAFQRLYEEIKKAERPFFAMISTLHPHPPHKLPNHKKINFSGEVGFYEDMKYTDECLEDFFKMVQKEEFFKDTLFIVTSDHAYEKKKGLNLFHTPLLFYAPALIRPEVDNELASHLDILPTVLDLLELPGEHSSMGKSPLGREAQDRWALVDLDSLSGWMQDGFLLLSSHQESVGLYNYKTDPLLKMNLISKPGFTNIQKRLEGHWVSFSSAVGYSIMNNRISP